MDISFISKDNILNLYDYINTELVKEHNFNLNINTKYKKIVKKLIKVLFSKLNSENKNILLQDFNSLAKDKCKNYLITIINNDTQTNNEAACNLVDKYEDNIIIENNKKKLKRNRSKKLQEKHIKESNRKIKENMKQIINSKNEVESNDKNSLLNSFESLIETKLQDSIELNNYDTPSMNELLKSVTLNPQDNSNEFNVENYEKEDYLPNHITKLGEQAPVQPLLYQNSGYGTERINKKVIVIDSGSGNNAVPNSTVINLDGTKKWHKFKVNLQETIKLDKLTDVYLKSFTLINPALIQHSMYFVVNIDEFEIRTHSNNVNLRNNLVILNNTITTGLTKIFAVNYPTSTNYITTLNPMNISNLTITLNDENNLNVGTTNKVFNSDNAVNRVIFELEFKSVGEREEILIDKNIEIDTINKLDNLINN